jgi:hypothetical protein
MSKGHNKEKTLENAVEEAAELTAEGVEVVEVKAAEVAEAATTVAPLKKKKKRNWPIILGVLALVGIVVGVGALIWHEQPSFCGAICHNPMDPYYATYGEEPGKAGTDKWGNAVSDSNAMMVVSHKVENRADCLACHVPSLGVQMQEGLQWVTGSFESPLEESTLSHLVKDRGVEAEEFCLNAACHDMDRKGLMQKTAERERNPHNWLVIAPSDTNHAAVKDAVGQCDSCHKGHRASVFLCSQCHSDYDLPDGWITWAEEQSLAKRYGRVAD